ncbi:substrate-binding domain-containing protein [Sphingobium sp. 10 DY56-G10]|uniref:LacI family DNA-binding transcriptional regulator n=1 Tax=Sphingomonadales TaxID=204457 RepID=UPI0000D7A975|nr:substrate-binding domain-containing protein [Sphingomonas sp. SKA58]EAT09536.1 transcriptional regulator, LacI family protein [Sphingomonas sp. SKA58]
MKTIGLVELAKIAGVHVSTVSRALDDNPRVSAKTKARIRALAEEHGFRLNQTASFFRRRRTGAVGVVFPLGHEVQQSLSDPFFMGLLGPLADALAEQRYDLLLSRVVPGDESWLENMVRSGRVDGIILIGQSDQTDVIEGVAKQFAPLVVWGAHRPGLVQTTVGTDNLTGGDIAAQHLIAMGRRRLAFLGDPAVPEFADRYAGFHQAIGQAAEVEEILLPLHLTDQDAYADMARYLESHPSPDGIFAASDVIAMSAMRAVADQGLRVPQDVSIIGYDDISISAHTVPPLTTIRQDMHKGARLLVDLLIRRLAGETVTSVAMTPELILRGTA